MNRQNLAAPELAAIDVKGVTRQAFLVRGTLAAGAVYGALQRRPVRALGAGRGRR